jgi:hypothetical protein
MTASTRSISLVLIGSALFLAGCRRDRDEDKDNPNGVGGSYRGGGVYLGGTGFRSGGGTSTSSPSVGASARGGFGGTASGASASS